MLKMFLLLATFSRLLVFELPVTNLSRLFNVATSHLPGNSSIASLVCFRFPRSEIHHVLSALGQHLWHREAADDPVRELKWKAPIAP